METNRAGGTGDDDARQPATERGVPLEREHTPDWSDRPDPRAWELARTHPSDLGFLLQDVDPDRLDDHTLVEVVAAWETVASWASAQAARAAGALAERPSMNPTWPEVAGDVAQPCVAGDELAMRLCWSRRAAERLVTQGKAFLGALTWTGDAVSSGALGMAQATVLVDALVDEPVELALQVQEAVLPDAARMAPTALRRRVDREILRLDPSGTRSRADAARRRRRVEEPRPLPHGMASIRAVLDAADAARIDTCIDAIARMARQAGDPRTLDQLRADVFRDLALGKVRFGATEPADGGTAPGSAEGLAGNTSAPGAPSVDVDGSEAGSAVAGNTETGTADGVTSGQSSTDTEPWARIRELPQRAVINVTVPLSTLLGTSDEPGELAGYGPVHADTARALALEGPWRRLVTDPLTGAVLDVGRTRYRPPKELADHVRHRDRTCIGPACSRSAHSCELDHTIAWDDGGTTAEDNLGPGCKRDHQIKTHAGYVMTQPESGRFVLETPTGQRYEVTPGIDDVVRREEPRSPWDDDASPPF